MTYYNASGANEAAKFGASNTIYGGTWNGVTSSASGSDTVDYSSIVDNTYNIYADLSTTSNNVQIRTNTTVHKSDSVIDVNNVRGTSGNDTFRGNANANVLNGGAGNNTVLYTFAALTAGVVIDLEAGTADKVISGNTITDTLLNIQNVVGSSYDDLFFGRVSEANIIDGGLNADNENLFYMKFHNSFVKNV